MCIVLFLMISLRIYPKQFSKLFVKLLPELRTPMPVAWTHSTYGTDMFAKLDWDDLWDDAAIRSVCHYMRGSFDLVIPPEWRGVLPTVL
jgi:hypothetical protein